jgi:mannobiose 2-epimerase
LSEKSAKASAMRFAAALLLGLSALSSVGCGEAPRGSLTEHAEEYLQVHVLGPRFPTVIDSQHWGFRSRFTRDWQPQREDNRFLVYQARIAWTAAFVGRLRPERAASLTAVAREGLAAIRRFRDADHGGFFTRVDLDGRPIGSADKATHVQAYGLLALSELARFEGLEASDRDTGARAARETFDWIERHAAIPGGGYRSALARDGGPLAFDASAMAPPRDGLGVPSAWQDLGTTLHLLEAYASLLRLAPHDAVVRARVEALSERLLGPFWSEPGCLHQALDASGRPVPNRVSFGHAVEAAALLLEAAETLGRPRDERVVAAARRLVDYALRWGFDGERGAWSTWASGVLAGPRNAAVESWVAFEAIHALARLHLVVDDAPARYGAPLAATWTFVRERLTDNLEKGYWEGLDGRGRPIQRKSWDWLATYHEARALVVAADALG